MITFINRFNPQAKGGGGGGPSPEQLRIQREQLQVQQEQLRLAKEREAAAEAERVKKARDDKKSARMSAKDKVKEKLNIRKDLAANSGGGAKQSVRASPGKGSIGLISNRDDDDLLGG